MKKISEMTEDEVRDYALKLESEKATFAEKEKEYQTANAELDSMNKALQRRNNELFLQVEQNVTAGKSDEKEKEPEKEKTESCEDFARRLLEGVN